MGIQQLFFLMVPKTNYPTTRIDILNIFRKNIRTFSDFFSKVNFRTFSKFSEKIFFRKIFFDPKCFFMIFFQVKYFVKPHSFPMPVAVAHQIISDSLILEPGGRESDIRENRRKYAKMSENIRKCELLISPSPLPHVPLG